MRPSDDKQKSQRAFSACARIAICISLVVSACDNRPTPPTAEIRGEPIRRPSTTGTVLLANVVPPKSSNSISSAAGSDNGYVRLGFEKLASFKFDPGEELLNPQTNSVVRSADAEIPDAVKAFNGRRVSVRGFMLPLKVEGGVVTELLLMRDQSMCCYGVVPKINEWISVRMAGKGIKAIMDQAVTLYGSIHIGEMRENGYLVSIYRLDGEKMDLPED